LRLLLDEMYPAVVADQLRRRGHDVIAVTERMELRSLPDAAIFAAAKEERRAVVTENVTDFVPLADITDQRGEQHHGLILISPVKFPRGQRGTIGHLVTELDRLLNANADDAPTNPRVWL